MEGRRRPSWELTSVRNAARLLKEFSRTDRELGVSELARRLDLATSTVHRLLATLAAERLLERAPGGYRLGLAAFDLGANVSSHLDLHEAAMPVMATLRHTTGETVQLAVLDGLESVYIDRLESPHTVRIFSRVGTRLPATTTSTGKTLLAALPPDELDLRLAHWVPRRHTPYSIVDEGTLRARLREIAARGWAENLQESRVGVVSVGAPVRGADGAVVAALSVAAPTDRAGAAALHRIRTAVVDAAAVVSRRAGAPPRPTTATTTAGSPCTATTPTRDETTDPAHLSVPGSRAGRRPAQHGRTPPGAGADRRAAPAAEH